MRWEPVLAAPLALISPACWATAYVTVEQAQQAIFPGAKLVKAPLTLTPAQREALLERSGVHEPFREDRVWRVASGGFFVVDDVVGKHEMITYAVGIGRDGSVKRIEILEYRETYGHEIRQAAWRAQFVGKTAASPPRLNRDIVNISGATLSCKHVTDGVRRVLALHDLVLRRLNDDGR